MGAVESSMKNTYMEQVQREQAVVEQDLKAKRRARGGRGARQLVAPDVPQMALAEQAAGGDLGVTWGTPGTGGGYSAEAPAVDVRETGWLRWKRVIVPPNAHVVHTRLGEEKPLHCGLGISFRFNPYTDSYMVVPAAMQTIVISANCICRERQGILVQGYVQWIIEDFRTAYRKLDFSDAVEPMQVVNVQLREQAEATIKDTVATMGIDEVLADKQPIVKELTARLRQLAEGEEGLGLRIITVQIKEAVISSARVWETLQRAFRAERTKEARLAELIHGGEVTRRETEAEKVRAALEIEKEQEIAHHRSKAEAAAFDREQSERARRAEVEAETLAKTLAHEKDRLQARAELDRQRIADELGQEEMRLEARNKQAERDIELKASRRKVENDLSPAFLQQRLIDALPGIAQEMPKPSELKSINFGGLEGLRPFITDLAKLVDTVRPSGGNGSPS